MPRPPTSNRRVPLVLLGVVLVFGFNWPLLAIGLRDLSPLWLSSLRLLGASALIVPAMAVTGRLRLPARSDWPVVASVAVVTLSLVYVLVFAGLMFIPAGRSSVIVWTTSLWTIPMAALALGELMSPRRWAGLTVGILGVVLLFEPWLLDWSDRDIQVGHALLIAAAISNAAGSVLIRRHTWQRAPIDALPWQILLATIPTTAAAWVLEGLPRPDWTPQLMAIVVYEGLLATVFALWGQIYVLRRAGAITTNLGLMAIPVVGVVASALMLGEKITPGLAGGLVLVLVGVAAGFELDEKMAPLLGAPIP